METKIITPPATEPLSLDDAKKHLRVSGTANDTLITALIKQARETCEGYQRRKFITQTIEGYLDEFPTDSIELRYCGPVQSITSIIYTDSDGVAHTIDAADYSLDNISYVNKIDLGEDKSWPTDTLKASNGIKITMVCGYGAAAAVPESVKLAMVLHIKSVYDDLTIEERQFMGRLRDNLLLADRVW